MAELVAVRVPTASQFVHAWDRVAQVGDAVLPLDPRAPEAHVADIVRRMRPVALVTTMPGHPDRLRTVRLPDGAAVARGTAVVVATSGSSGPPKGVVLSARALDAATAASIERLGCRPGERWLLCLPWHHVAGLSVVRRSRALGVDPVLLDDFSVQGVAAAVREDGVRWTSLVPTQLQRLLDADVPLDGLRGVLLGGAAAPGDLLARAAERGISVTTSYGMTETCGGCVHDGLPLPGMAVEVRRDGRIRLRGPMVADGYRLDQEATSAAFDGDAFLASDLGRLDPAGRLEVLGRADDVIVSGGENVPAGRVAECLRGHPQVRDAAVVGMPDEVWGEVVCAVVEADAATSPTLDDLRDLVGRDLPRAWAPRRLATVAQLPRTSLGKPDGPAVRRLLQAPTDEDAPQP